jgi:hypothetical protein
MIGSRCRPTGSSTSAPTDLERDLDQCRRGKHITHLRSMLEHHDLLPRRDEHLARFETWHGWARISDRRVRRSISAPTG